MTLDEAIAHAREVAERNRKQYKNCPSDRTDIKHQTCEQCAEEHEQLAEWLEELKAYREGEFDVLKKDGQLLYKQGILDGYNKAIDDFYTRFICEVKNCYPDMPIANFFGERNLWIRKNAQYIECEEIALKIAEQLKKGGVDAGIIREDY